jgi:hypothetical protein
VPPPIELTPAAAAFAPALAAVLVNAHAPNLRLVHALLDCWAGMGSWSPAMSVSLGEHGVGRWSAAFFHGWAATSPSRRQARRRRGRPGGRCSGRGRPRWVYEEPDACLAADHASGPARYGPVGREPYGFVNELSVMVWLPPTSIASTSKSCSSEERDATNSGGTVTLSWVAGTVTWNAPTMS